MAIQRRIQSETCFFSHDDALARERRLSHVPSVGAGGALIVALALVFGASTLLLAAAADDADARPNIVFLMADDMGSGDLGCYNPDSKIPTPNLNRLAAQGMRFTDAHSPSAVCTPTRYGVLTGRYAWRSRLKSGVLWGWSTLLIEPGRVTVPSLLKANGYATGCVGKWHLGFQAYDRQKTEKEQRVDYSQALRPGPLTVGFDAFFGIPASLDMEPYLYVRNDLAVKQPSDTVAKSEHRRRGGGGFWRGGPMAPGFKHIDVLPEIGRESAAFIDAQSGKSKPFFLYIPLSAPHTPWLPTAAWRGKSEAGYYGDFTAQVDSVIGQVIQSLDRNGLTENTLLIVTSDNGAHWPVSDVKKFGHGANAPYRGQKADIHEGGHRVPYLVRWPGHVAAGSVCRQTICHTDLLATCAAVIDIAIPDGAGEDSYSILPALLKQDDGRPLREATVHHSVNGTFAIRQGDWKLIEGRGSGGFTKPAKIKPKPGEPVGQLYNLASDIGENENVYQENPEVVRRLTALLAKYKKTGRSRP